MEFTLSRRRVFVCHLAIIAMLIGLHFAVVYYAHSFDAGPGLLFLFDVDQEGNVPTIFSTVALLITGVVAWLNSYAVHGGKKRDIFAWRLIALLLLFMAIDEGGQVHDTLGDLVPVHATGIFYYQWVALYGPIAVIVALILAPFWFRQSTRVKILFALGSVVYVGAAVGVEIIEALTVERLGEGIYQSMKMAALGALEEGGEMVGVALLLQSCLTALVASGKAVNVSIIDRHAHTARLTLGEPSAMGAASQKPKGFVEAPRFASWLGIPRTVPRRTRN